MEVLIPEALVCVCVWMCVWPKSLSGCVSVRCASVPGDGVGGLQDLLGRAAGARRVPGLGGPLHGRLGQRRRHRQVLQPIRGARRPHQECRFSPGGTRWWSDWLPQGMLPECEILRYWCTLGMKCAVFSQCHWLISTWTWFHRHFTSCAVFYHWFSFLCRHQRVSMAAAMNRSVSPAHLVSLSCLWVFCCSRTGKNNKNKTSVYFLR